ncbi:NYN domain-containing protein [Microbacterium pygmaeum]|uniref:Uncharacterized conserved protein, LabA/DUF88 family n=1 Tax=Microbacterium pygmaeum TaxID=370764 RepID=A0A1G7YW97_9MICO|nr:NYN domain-containing protein [Microbacterium pygmaeum]SDH00842.1 Uncharacterized conserved protein, LabA/DUF88 family [Microbacterium pygmaeum]
MPDSQDSRVAVYLDFDNIVISWYDRVHGRNSYGRDRQRIAETPDDPEIAERLSAATIDVGAIIDYAASFGTLVLTRAYADWSSPVNAVYRSQLVARAVDLVQLFPAAAYAKNGADIRLAVDAVEDMFRLPDLTHVVIVAGDSDYVPLAQRCKRLGRYVVGVGVAGSTAKSLAAACDEFEAYDSLPGVPRVARAAAVAPASRSRAAKPKDAPAPSAEPAAEPPADAPASKTRSRRGAGKSPAKDAAADVSTEATPDAPAVEAPPAAASAPADVEASLLDALGPATPPRRTNRRATSQTVAGGTIITPQTSVSAPPEPVLAPEEPAEDPQETATRLLERALRLGHDKNDDSEWLHSSTVKGHMRRMDPSFSEKALGYRSFNDFVKARDAIAELEETGHERLVRLRDQ